jgi:hypothetical protein
VQVGHSVPGLEFRIQECKLKIVTSIVDAKVNALCRYGAAEYVEDGIPADIDLRSRYEAQEKKAEHNKLLKQLRLQHPELVLSRHRTVDALLIAGANPLQQVSFVL